jgi:hypothetical protein
MHTDDSSDDVIPDATLRELNDKQGLKCFENRVVLTFSRHVTRPPAELSGTFTLSHKM